MHKYRQSLDGLFATAHFLFLPNEMKLEVKSVNVCSLDYHHFVPGIKV
jgi:hypothetical protein